MKVHMLYIDLELKGVYADKKIAKNKLENAKKKYKNELKFFKEDNWIDTHTIREK